MKLDKTTCYRYGMLICSIVFFLFWFFYDGIRVAVDTDSYVNFSMSREPLYPTFLAMFRKIFGQSYFNWVGVFQCLLGAYSVWYLCDALFREMKLDKISYGIMLGINLGVCLITRFLTVRKTMYHLDMATEGIAVSLFTIFVTMLLVYVLTQKNKYLIGVIFLGILLLSVRKQMYIVVPIMAAMFFVLWLTKWIKLKKLIILWGLTIVTLLGSVMLDRTYNYAIRGEAIRHTTDSSALLINAVFVATKEDAVHIDDEDVRKLFIRIIETKENNGWGYESSPDGVRALSKHYANNFDNIAFNIVNPALFEYLEKQGVSEYVESEIAFGELNNYIFSSIFSTNIKKILHVFMANAITGMCNTIAKDSSILIPIVMLLYFSFAVSVLFLWKKKKIVPEVLFAIEVAICIMINVLAVSFMIFSQSRYMIYNMPLFYCSLYVMLRKILEILYKQKNMRESENAFTKDIFE